MMKARTSSNASPLLSEHTPNNTKTKPTLEQKIRQYLAVFDGKTKDFSDVEHLFDALFHSDYSSTNQHYRHETRDQIKTQHSRYFAMGTKATLLDYRRVGFNTVDVSYHLINDEEDIVTRQLMTRKNCSLIRTQQLSLSYLSYRYCRLGGEPAFVIINKECKALSYMKARWNSHVYSWDMARAILFQVLLKSHFLSYY